MTMTGRIFLILFFRIAPTDAIFPSEGVYNDDLHKEGDLNIGALFSLYKTEHERLCGSSPWDTMVRSAQAMVFMIDVINKDSSILDNITLGYAILNDCNRQSVALAKTTQFLPVAECVRQQCGGITPVTKTAFTDNITGHLRVPEDIGKPFKTYDQPRLYYDVVGVIASYSSKFAVLCSSLLGVYKIPEISWSATSNELSDKTRYEYFSRVVPPDVYQAQALVSILKHFNWTYISTLHSEGSYGADGIKNVIKFARKEGICVAYSRELTPDETHNSYDKVVQDLQKNYKAKAVIMFILPENAHGIFEALARANAIGQFYFLGSDGFAFDDLKGVKEMAVNSLYIDLVTSSSAAFEEYYMKLSPWNQVANGNPWEGQYIPEYMDCSWESPQEDADSCWRYRNITDFSDYPFSQSPTGVMDAVKTFAVALHQLITQKCPEAKTKKNLLSSCVTGPELLTYIREVEFDGYSGTIELDPNGDLLGGYNIRHVRPGKHGMDMVRVGYWSRQGGQLELDESSLQWFTSMNATPEPDEQFPESVCAKPCSPGEFYVRGELVCCWDCRRCRSNEQVRADGYGCEVCPENTWPDQDTFTTCLPIPPTYLNWVDPIGLGLIALAAIGLCSVLVLVYIFTKHRNKKVIKGSSVELMAFINVGLFLAYATVFAFITMAETWSCYTNYFGFNLSCTLIFGPLFVKTNRLYRIFAASENLKKGVRMVDITSQIVFIVLVIIIQVSVTSVTAVLFPPAAVLKMPVATERFVELLCVLPLQNLLIPLSYNLLLLLLCAVFGFLTRKLPDNFNESWYIFISVVTTLFVWIAFLPTYFVAFYAYHKAALLALALILNSVVTSLCLFTPKIYALYYVDEKNIKVTNFESSQFDSPSVVTETN